MKKIRDLLRGRPSTDRELLDRVEQYVAAERAVAEASQRCRSWRKLGNLDALREAHAIAVVNADEARRSVDRRVREVAGSGPADGSLRLAVPPQDAEAREARRAA